VAHAVKAYDMTGSCGSCGQTPAEVRAEAERQVNPLLRQHAALTTSTHIYANCQLRLIQQELARYGVEQSAEACPQSQSAFARAYSTAWSRVIDLPRA
jgi:hypothetical protein